MRPIDADVLFQEMIKTIANMMRTRRWMRKDETNEEEILSVIQNAPTLDCEPVRHGKWVLRGMTPRTVIVDEAVKCKVCGSWFYRIQGIWFKRCPECGAHMDGGKDDV